MTTEKIATPCGVRSSLRREKPTKTQSEDTYFRTSTITIGDVDEFDVGAITDSNVAANTVAENAANGTLVGITASAADGDATNNTITYSLDNDAGGRFAIDANTGVVTSAGPLDYETFSSHTITIRATSADSSFSTQTYLVNVLNVNEAPSVVAAVYSTTYLDSVNTPAPGLLTLASDPENDTLTVSLVTAPNQGTVVVSANGAFTYQPTLQFVGTTQFTVAISDGQFSVQVNITVVIAAPNVPPPDLDGGGDDGGSGDPDPQDPVVSSEDDFLDDSPEDSESQPDSIGPSVPQDDPHANNQNVVVEDSESNGKGDRKEKSGGWNHPRFNYHSESPDGLNGTGSDVSKKSLHFVLYAGQPEPINETLFKDLQYFLTLFGELDRQHEDELKNHYIIEVDPILTAAMGTGLLIWALHAGNMVTTLLTTTAAMSHVDPLVVLDGKQLRDDDESDWDEAEKLLDSSKPDR